MLKIVCLALIPVALLLAPLSAQEDNGAKHLRFIPLGDLPPLLFSPNPLPLPGILPLDLPPSPLSLISLISEKGRTDFLLSLGSFSKVVTIPAETPRLILQKGKEGTKENWLTSKMPTAPLSLGVLYQDPKAMT
jgi:hypothetical protein